MNVVIDKETGIPLYIQLETQIMYLIKKGTLRVGNKMPTERELSKELSVSRNTVSTAYNELESKGVLKSIRGSGTFVAEEALSWKDDDCRRKVNKFVDLALEEALESGIDLNDFLDMVTKRVNEKKDAMHRMNSVFIECNTDQARMYSREIAVETGMNVIPLTLKDIEKMNKDTKKKLEECQVIIAPFNHVNDIENSLEDNNKKILGVETNMNLESFVKIARYPKGTKFAFICISEEFMFKIKTALSNAGLSDININYYNGNDEKKLRRIIDDSEVLVVTPGRSKDVRDNNFDNKEIIEFSYTLDSESIKTLKCKIVELKYQRN